jgi:dipeptidyl aminopeptidase/acylaminoacyl peptidase
MTDLNERFRTLDRLAPPDLWDDAERRRPGTRLLGSRRHRLITAAVALVVAAAGIGLAARTFVGSRQRDTSGVVGSPLENGVIAYVSNGEIWLVQADGSEAARVEIDAPGLVGGPAWSPDGRRLAFDVNSYPPEGAPKGGYDDVYVANADGSDVVRLTYERGARLPAWSPDNSRIAYASQQPDGGSQIFAMNADGSDPNQLTSGPAFNMRPAWSPDGASIAFESVFDRNSDVYVMSADGSDPHRLTNDLAWDGDPVWSPDGDHIVFASDRDPSGIYMMNADGSDVRLIEPDDDVANLNIAWSPDGRYLAFSSSRGPGFARAIYVLELSSGVVTQITDRGELWGPAWQPLAGDDRVSPVPAPEESVWPSPPTSAEVVDTFPVGEVVSSVAYGEGSVWVAASFHDGNEGGKIVRIDPVTHEVLAEIPVDVIPTWEVGGGAMVVADGSLWVTGAVDKPGTFEDPGGGVDAAVIQIDTSTDAVVQTFEVGGDVGADLTFLSGELWVLLFGDETVDNAMEIVRVDPGTGDVLARLRLDADWAHTLVAADGRLVTAVGGENAVNVDGRVIEIDPVAGAVSGIETPSRSFTPMPVLWRGQVWISTDPGFVRFDPLVEGFPQPPVTLPPRFGDCCGFLDGDDRGIWFLSPDLDGGPGRFLNVFDPAIGDAIALVELDEGAPVAMAVAPDAVWILNYEGTLTHVGLG